MAGRFEATVVIERPIEDVFSRFSRTVRTIRSSARGFLKSPRRVTGSPGVGTVYASTIKDAGMKTKHEFNLTEFEPFTRIR